MAGHYSTMQDRELLYNLYWTQGLSTYKIADKYGVSYKRVSKWLKRLNIPTRPYSTKGLKFPGRKLTQEHKEKLSKWHTGKPLSSEHRDKVIKALSKTWVKGFKHHSWKGGRYINKKGYVMMKFGNTYRHEHRMVMEMHLDRLLKREEHIHHINGIKTDNRIVNLLLVSNYEHSQIHWTDPKHIKEQSERMKKIRSKKFWSTKKITPTT